MSNGTSSSILKKITMLIIILIISIVSLMVSFSQFSSPLIPSGSVSVTEFSTERAMDYLENIAKEPHPIGTKANKEVRDYIIKSFRDLDIHVEVQSKDISEIKDALYSQENLDGKVENIIAKIPGSLPSENAVILTAHYDSTSKGPGAADDGYGVSTILEVARALKNSPEPSNTIYFLLTDGEEPGMLGASVFIDNKEILNQAKIIINLEARGNKGVPILFETNSNNLRIMKIFQKTVEYPVAYSFAYEVYQLLHNDTDFSVYKNMNKQGYNFANVDGAESYHQMIDSIENVDKNTLQHFGIYTFSLAKKFAYMGAQEFKEIEESKGNAIYFPISQKNLVVYSEFYVIPMCIFLVLGTCFTIFIFWKRRIIKMKDLVTCTLLILGGLIIIAGLIFLLIRLIAWILKLQIHGYFYIFNNTYSNFIIIFITVLIVSIYIFKVNWLVRKFGISNAAFGLILVWIIFSSFTSLLVKGMSYAFVIPSILFVISTIPMIFKIEKFPVELYKYFFCLLWIIPCLILVAPIIYLVFVVMTIGIAPVAAILISLVILPCIISIRWIFCMESGKFILKHNYKNNVTMRMK
ncbi:MULTISPECIES: M20/M25/M40 family metallo-hydrolase [Bacillus cereus group]|uniref:M20/M25/M40 family metallo-hydrolase n=1 Tax=Bacillus cereus group TaxID=86661 RepID=UPI000BF51869|nr:MULTISPECIES: M20/M25/M40 family metallo-hydrolase [Bacillus cereus group]PEV20663.1 hypothetical protein CN420_25765 [Bacillus thuringiensis]PEX77946.1 hypothetical protein CN462_00115 [Bacillus cereus]PFL18589.1 hypothetical protein COJ22_26210 [Bacillus cereus]PFR56420.1 hypothetical protein COK36_28650 [Bacillus cereus]PFS68922.1 hypothetical protein COK50_26370 [Bacillus thuringiensis]